MARTLRTMTTLGLSAGLLLLGTTAASADTVPNAQPGPDYTNFQPGPDYTNFQPGPDYTNFQPGPDYTPFQPGYAPGTADLVDDGVADLLGGLGLRGLFG